MMKLIFTYSLFSAMLSWFGVPENNPTLPAPAKQTPESVTPQSSYIRVAADWGLLYGHLDLPLKDAVEITRLADRTPVGMSPIIAVTKTYALSNDTGLAGPSPGDELTYTVTITNSGAMDATALSFTDQIDANTTLVAGSLKRSPILYADTYNCIGNVGLDVNTAAGGVIGNDVDLDGDVIQATAINTAGTQGTVTMNPDGTFTFKPAAGFEGTTTFTYTASDGLFTSTGTVTINVSRMIWFVDNNAGVNGDGRLGTPFNSMANFNSGAADDPGDIIFLYRNTATNYTGPLTLLNNQYVIGAGASSSIASIAGITVPPFSNILPSTAGTNPVLAHTATNLTLGQNNKLHGFNISNTVGGIALTGTGTSALQIRDMSISHTAGQAISLTTGGALDVILKSVSAAGAGTGMLISGTTGSFQITGVGTTDGSGGTISNITNRGVDIQNATNITLKNMTFTNANTVDAGTCNASNNTLCNAAIHLGTVTTAVLNNVDINGTTEQGINLSSVTGFSLISSTLINCGVASSGADTEESCLYGVNVDGTSAITNSSLTKPSERAAVIYNTNKTLVLSVTGSTFGDNQSSALGADGLEIDNLGSSNLTLDVDNTLFTMPKTNGLQVISDNTAVASVDITNSTFDAGPSSLAAAIDLVTAGTANMDFNIIGNPLIKSRGINAVNIQGQGSSTFQGRVKDNPNVTTSSGSGIPIRVLATANSVGKVLIQNNVATGADDYGILCGSNGGTGRLDANILSNNITIGAFGFYCIQAIAGASSSTFTNKTCANIVSNTTSFTAGAIGNAQYRSATPSHQLLVQGGGTTAATNWNANTNFPLSPTATISQSGTGTFTFGSTCLLPTNPLPLMGNDPVAGMVVSDPGTDVAQTNTVPDAPQDLLETPATPTTTGTSKSGKSDGAAEKMMSGETVTTGPVTIPANSTFRIQFKATINTPFPVGVCSVSNQATVSGSNFATVLSDDPGVAGTANPTVTTVLIAPTIATCPPNLTVDPNNTNCTSTQSFAAVVNGCPTPTVTYKIGATTITSPFAFPTGLSTVNVTATNGNAPDATCSFTVTVNPPPTAFNVTGGGTICSTDPGLVVSLGGSQTGVNYQLVRGGATNVGAPLPGTGSSLNFPAQTTAGTYTVVATGPGGCTTTMNGSAVIVVSQQPTANAGMDQAVCGSGSATLAATFTNGTGAWSVVSGPSTSLAQFSSSSSPTATFTPAGGPGTYTLRWTVTNAPCTAATDDVVITVSTPPSGNAGMDQSICANSSATLAATFANGTGAWSVVSGPSTSLAQFSSTSNPTATFTPAGGGGTYTLRWTVTAAGCPSATDDVVITASAVPTAGAGMDQAICGNASATLAATFTNGTGAWSVVSGPSTSLAQFSSTSSPTATFTPAGGAGNYTLRWTVTNAPCPDATDDVVITASTPPSGNAGMDQTICSDQTATMAATFANGTGAWSVVSGPSTSLAQFSSTSSPTAVFTPAGGVGTYTLRWTVSAPGCTNVTDDVIITVISSTTAIATPSSQSVCTGTAITTIVLSSPNMGTTFAWTRDNTGTVTGIAANGTGNISGTLVNTTNAPITVTFTITPSLGTCTGPNITATVTVNPLPIPGITVSETSGTVNNDGIICAGATASLTGTGGTSYAWSTGGNTAAINVTPASTTTYTVTVTNANGCTATASTTITVNPLPTPGITVSETSGNVNNDGITCAFQSATLTATGGGTYLWSVGGFTTAAILVNPGSTTTYTVTVTNANNCTATASTTITVNPLPTPGITISETSGTVNNDGVICVGATASLTGTGGTSYVWSTGGNTATINVTPASTTTYTVTVTNANGCSATATTTITVNPLPTPGITVSETSGTVNNDGIICAGATASLTGTGGTSYAWSTGGNTAAINVAPASTTTYTVTVTNANGCTATASTTITVNPLPTPGITVAETSGTVNNDGIICVGGTVTLTGTGGTSYAWSTGGNTAAINVTPASTTTYTVTVTNANGCIATATTTITVNPLPTPGITVAETSGTVNNDGIICVGATATLTGTGGTSYAWNTGGNTAAINVTPASTTTYTVTVTNANNCSSTATTTITVNPLPTPGITVAETSGTANNDGIICVGATATLTGTGGTSYAWNTGGNTAAINVTPASTTTYTVTVTNANGCSATATTTITVNPLPTPGITVSETSGNINNDGVICAGVTATLTGTGGTSYAWSTGGNTATINVTPASTTTYTVTVTNANGCTATSTTTITVNPLPTPSISIAETSGSANNDGEICLGASATLTATGGTTYVWSTGANTAAITVTPAATTTYTVTVTNANNCAATATATITVTPLPVGPITVAETSGTANNDGIICVGASVGLTAPVAVSYSWSTGGNTATINVTPASTTTYTVTVTNANSCISTASVTITVNPLPTPATTVAETSGTTANDGIICAGASATITATGGTSYAWSTGANTAAITVTPAATTTYTVTVTNANGCSATSTRTITVNPLPTPAIAVTETSGTTNNDGIICVGASATLTASGGTSYAWSTGGNTAAITVTPAATTTYTVTVTNANGCSATASTTITVNPLPVNTFTVTGGGGFCQGSSTVPVGLSGSQTGVNYQLQINGTNSGAPLAGTGAALNFGNFNTVGTYTVIGTTVATGCSTTMTGSVTVFSFNCNATISDPCVCLNNATTLTNGQFGEQIKVNAPSNQIWTVSAVTGLYTTGSPAPPAAPIPITVGTVLTNIGGNMFTLDGRHIDAIGYTISVTNGAGTTLSIGNSCQYPNPSITSDLTGPFCLYSAPVTLTGNPGDGSIVSQTFTVNGTTTTTFDPGAGVGQYTIVYTVNGGTPKATGPNDPGCIQSVSQIVNVVATPSSLICNDLVYVSLDVDCVTEILPDDILEGTYGCDDDYTVELDKTVPYGNGPWVPAVVGISDVGQTYQVRITHLVSGNKCWGNVKIEDKLEPVIECTDIDLSCPITTYDPAYLLNVLGIAEAYPDVVECSSYTLTYVDTWHDLACNQGFNGVNDLSAYVARKWTAKDAWNNTSTCVQYIYFHRVHVGDVDFPADFVINCSGNVNTDPSVTGVPYYKDFGINWKLFPDPGFCELQAAYTDQILPVCDGTYKILRTWTLVDWCLPTTPFPPTQNPLYYIQLIKVLDSQGPAMVCPANLTVSTDPYNCCATTNLPDVIIEDNCSRVNNISAMVTTFDPYTGDQTGMYTVDGALTTFPGNNFWDLDTLGNWGWTPCLPVGRQTVVYTAEDDCGNTSTCSFRLTVADYQPPVAACDQYTVVAIGTDDPADCYTPADGCDGAGVTWVKAKTFDDGSTDNCNGLHFTIRRMDPYSDCINNLEDCEKPNATEERDSIKFYCCEVGTTQTVILRVYQVDVDGNIMNGQDGTPLFNECMVNVEVQDKIKPVCLPPANVTVACENFDASLWVYGKATVYDNCCLDTTKVYQGQCGLSHSANYNLFDTVCNKGTITRTFKAYDCHGLTSQCTQRVVVQYNQDYYVKFPNDVIVTVCDGTGNYGEPSFFGEDCELLGVSYEDQVFTVVPDACFKIERVWTIINWCTYNPNLPCIEVPNPNPNAISNNPANLPGPIVSRAGTLAPWAPTVVKINPTDATATNYSTFWNKDANCYRYKQIIKVIDTQDPTIENCPASPVTFCDITPNDPLLWNEMYWWDNVIGQHDLCEGPTDLTITATDACSAANINFRYLLFLDLDNDGTMETVINSVNTGIAGLGWNAVPFGNAANPNYTGGTLRSFDGRAVPFNQKYGFAIQTTTSGTKKTASVRWNTQQSQNNFVIPELPYGTHKIKWFVEDGCGNESICEYTFIVKDCKKPTVVCLNGLSVNIMPTQMIQLWASDFLKYTEDNCTPANQLKIAIRKSGTGTGFPVDGNGNPITNVTFTCDELGTQLVELWSIDKAGNADFCETYVIVQDNNGNCPNVNAAKVAGALATEAVDGVEEGAVEITGSSNAVPSFTFTTMSNNTGNYNFNAIPLASNSTVTPAKDDNPLNGVSTYDLVLISKHILGIEALNSPYKMIAADANKSGSITTFDIVELRKLILGIYSELPTNTSWRFVDKSFAFPNAANPFQTQFAESKAIQNLTTDQLNEDFVSVKVGDVNGTAIANSLMSADDRTAGTLLFDVNDQSVRAGETFTVALTPAQASQGYQFTLNTNGLEVTDIAGVKGENYAVFADATTFSVDGNQAQAPITLTLKATKAGKLSEMLSVSSRITKAEAYGTSNIEQGTSNVERYDIALRFNNGGVQTISGVGFELYQNQPNPFVNKTFVGFHLPEAAAATLSIYDETGRVVFTQNGNFAKGYNTITIDRALLNTTGMLYYKLETATDSATKKMIQSK